MNREMDIRIITQKLVVAFIAQSDYINSDEFEQHISTLRG